MANAGRVSTVKYAFVHAAAGMAAATLILAAMVVAVPRPADAKPEFAAKTGFPCGQCHVSQTGGGPLKPYGEAFKANGFNVPKK